MSTMQETGNSVPGNPAYGTDLLQQRLNDPRIAEGLSRLLDRIDSVSFAVEAVEGFVARSEVIADSVAESVQELHHADPGWKNLLKQAPQMAETGAKLAIASQDINIEELQKSNLLQRLSDPQTLTLLNSLLDRLPLVAFLAESMEGFIRRSETIADNVTDMVQDLKLGETKIDLDSLKALAEQLPKLQAVGEQLLNSDLAGEGLPKAVNASVNLLNSGMLDKNVVDTLGHVGRLASQTYQEVSAQPVKPVGGIFAMMRAAKDPDVQKSVGFAFAFAKAFAKHLK